MRRRSLTLALLVAAFGACVDNPRTCPAFDFDAANGWAVGQTGDVLRFASATGNTSELRLERADVDRPQPALGGGDSYCDMYAVYHYSRTGVDTLQVAFRQTQARGDVPPKDWSLTLESTVKLPQSLGVLAQTYSFALSRLPDPGDGSMYSPSRTIGGVSYIDVVEKVIGPEFTQAPVNDPRIPNELAWVRVAYARNVGLVEFELRDGTVYSRVAQ
jgi:hypothetical protein